jgi:hypothetical protein
MTAPPSEDNVGCGGMQHPLFAPVRLGGSGGSEIQPEGLQPPIPNIHGLDPAVSTGLFWRILLKKSEVALGLFH